MWLHRQGEVRVWELRNRDLVSHLKEHTKRVTGVKVFEDDVFVWGRASPAHSPLARAL